MCKDEYVQTTDESVGRTLVNVNDGLFDVFLCYWLGYIYVEKRQGNRKTFMYICFVPLNNTQLTI